jgi:hypothetical protein
VSHQLGQFGVRTYHHAIDNVHFLGEIIITIA